MLCLVLRKDAALTSKPSKETSLINLQNIYKKENETHMEEGVGDGEGACKQTLVDTCA